MLNNIEILPVGTFVTIHPGKSGWSKRYAGYKAVITQTCLDFKTWNRRDKPFYIVSLCGEEPKSNLGLWFDEVAVLCEELQMETLDDVASRE